jgi:hypothetical protein
MDRRLEKNLYFEGEVFIPIQDAFDYLMDESVVYELNQLFFYYKGFANEYFCEETYLDFEEGYVESNASFVRLVYLDAVARLGGSVLYECMKMLRKGGSLYVRQLVFNIGTINGEDLLHKCLVTDFITALDDSININNINVYDLGSIININNSNVYVRQSDLDDASKEFGISKNPMWANSVSINNGKEQKSNFDDSNSVTPLIDTSKDFIIDFTKSVLIEYPEITTADLKKNCFEDMNNLNSRDSKIINEILIKAGAKKAKRGEHAKDIAWETKYPKAQWMRVFNKIN